MELDYLKYLKTEREISEFKINSLKKVLSKKDPSTKRLLAIEEEFLSIPFEKIVSNLSELLSAIKIFRESRTKFFELYNKEEVTTNTSSLNFKKIKENLKEKIWQFF